MINAAPIRKIIGFTDFSGTFQDTAVTNEKDVYHFANSPCIIGIS